ncbi:CoA-binding protein [Bifidobacterium sp.]|uniref:CoA-binding protein n=1 Tax=Bifidobacterium sp. TaxID=41200 RepID=UPI0039ED08D8
MTEEKLSLSQSSQQISLNGSAAHTEEACVVAPAVGERNWKGPDAEARNAILEKAHSIAIVGASANPARASYFVATYLLQSTHYKVYFINPNEREILGHPVYRSLDSLPKVPDIVDVFRRSSAIDAIADEAARIGSPVLWIQLGIWDDHVAEHAESLGLEVVMDRCIKIEHARFHQGLHLFGFNTGVISSRKAR